MSRTVPAGYVFIKLPVRSGVSNSSKDNWRVPDSYSVTGLHAIVWTVANFAAVRADLDVCTYVISNAVNETVGVHSRRL
jgi:hypothetical protein